MIKLRFRLSKDAKKYITSQDKQTKKSIYQHLRNATKNPPKGDIIPMSDNSGRYRLRDGDFRFLLFKRDNYLIVAKISPRGDAYKK